MDRIDRKFRDLGFVRLDDNKFGVSYRRETVHYIHRIDILKLKSGDYVIKSYQEDFTGGGDYNNAIGMGLYETQLALKRLKRMRRKGYAE